MTKYKLAGRLPAVILCVILSATTGAAQTTSGSILGTVQDQTQALLPGVSVTITNTGTGAVREVLTDDAGRYVARQLTLGSYEVETSLPGFQTAVRSGIQLTVGREAIVNFSLALGEISERVQVMGDAPLIETTSSTISGLVDERQMQDLPLNGRSFSDLVTLQMGAARNTIGRSNNASGYGVKISVSGARPSENSFLLDGNFVNDTMNGTPSGATGLFLGIETLREFNVLTNTFSAEYGQSSGAIINAVTKSGTNELHGSVFYYHRNSVLDARNYFDTDPDNPLVRSDPPVFRRHQFGGTVGGPIVPDKTFFFAGYEGLREALGLSFIFDTLTEEARQGIIPGQPPIPIWPGVEEYFFMFPLPNGRPKAPGAAEYLYTRTNIGSQDNFVAKIDHNFSDDDSLFVRYTIDDSENPRPALNYTTNPEVRNQYITIEEKHVFSPTLLNVARVGFNRSTLSEFETPDIDVPVQITPTNRSSFPEVGEGLVGIFTVTGTRGSVAAHRPGNEPPVPRFYIMNLFEYSDTVTYMRGAHSIKFGANVKRVQSNMVSPQRFPGVIGFGSIEDFLRGDTNRLQLVDPNSVLQRGIRYWVMGFFVQDDVQVRPNLTLNLGLRYEPATVHTEVNGRLANLRNHRTDTALTVGDPFFLNPTKSNFAPRIGLAWDPFGDGKTSVRAGTGIFYNLMMSDVARITTTSNPPFTTVTDFGRNVQFPFDFDDLFASAGGSTPTAELIDYQGLQPYRIQWNLNVQREILPNTTLTVGYVGARGVDLFRIWNANQVDPVPSTDPSRPTPFYFPDPAKPVQNPNFGPIVVRSGGADSWYNALQLSVIKRFSSRFQFQGSYTWSKSLDTSSKSIRGNGESRNTTNQMNPFNLAGEKAVSDFGIGRTLSINGIVQLPGETLSGAAGHILGGWQLGSIITVADGNPYPLRAGSDRCNCRQGTSGGGSSGGDNRPDLIPGGNNNPVLGGPDHYFDETQFVLQPLGYYGTLGRNTLRIPGVATVDFSMMKKTALAEGTELQFRAEIFNIFNRANFGQPSEVLFSRSGARRPSGRITSTTTTSRQIQFALKITF